MIKLNEGMTPEYAQTQLRTINHKRFTDAIERHWTIIDRKCIKGQSLCWVYFGLKMLTPEQELEQSEWVDNIYQPCFAYLSKRTKKSRGDRLVREENKYYGLR